LARAPRSIEQIETRAYSALGFDLPGKLDGPAKQQELLGQGGLAGIRMRDDREGAAPFNLGCDG
jgi:hypothetical protein